MSPTRSQHSGCLFVYDITHVPGGSLIPNLGGKFGPRFDFARCGILTPSHRKLDFRYSHFSYSLALARSSCDTGIASFPCQKVRMPFRLQQSYHDIQYLHARMRPVCPEGTRRLRLRLDPHTRHCPVQKPAFETRQDLRFRRNYRIVYELVVVSLCR